MICDEMIIKDTIPQAAKFDSKIEFSLSEYRSKGGAARSEEALFYHLIPPLAMKREAQRWTLGAKDPTKGPHNWRLGIRDREFVAQIMDHLEEHWLCWKSGDTSDDHLAAMKWGCSALMEVERLAPEVLHQLWAPNP